MATRPGADRRLSVRRRVDRSAFRPIARHRNSLAVPIGSSLPRHDCGTCCHIAESEDDTDQHAGFARQILRAGKEIRKAPSGNISTKNQDRGELNKKTPFGRPAEPQALSRNGPPRTPRKNNKGLLQFLAPRRLRLAYNEEPRPLYVRGTAVKIRTANTEKRGRGILRIRPRYGTPSGSQTHQFTTSAATMMRQQGVEFPDIKQSTLTGRTTPAYRSCDLKYEHLPAAIRSHRSARSQRTVLAWLHFRPLRTGSYHGIKLLTARIRQS